MITPATLTGEILSSSEPSTSRPHVGFTTPPFAPAPTPGPTAPPLVVLPCPLRTELVPNGAPPPLLVMPATAANRCAKSLGPLTAPERIGEPRARALLAGSGVTWGGRGGTAPKRSEPSEELAGWLEPLRICWLCALSKSGWPLARPLVARLRMSKARSREVAAEAPYA